MSFRQIVSEINAVVWGPILLILLVGTGIFLMFRLRFLPLRNLGHSLRQVFKRHDKKGKGDITPFQSLMTALASTIGTGNIVGVTTAMMLGGPGAIFWMWVSAIFGLATKYAECMLSVKYRTTNEKGEIAGGPMYVLKNAFPFRRLGKILAVLFACFAVLASFGIGNLTQANSVAVALEGTFSIDPNITGVVLTFLALVIIVGGIQSIGKVSSKIVPIMAAFYIVGGLVVIFSRIQYLPSGIASIVQSAFSFESMAGGAVGTYFANSLRYGIARGLFSNEAGMGSAPIAAAAAKTDDPVRQGYISMTGTFFDTIVVCSITGLIIATSGLIGATDIEAPVLIAKAFSQALGPAGEYVVTIGMVLFAFSTILGWSYYGEKSLEFLAGSTKANLVYRIIFCLMVFVGAIAALDTVWDIAEIFNGLMALPNLICLLVMSGVVVKETTAYQRRLKIHKTK